MFMYMPSKNSPAALRMPPVSPPAGLRFPGRDGSPRADDHKLPPVDERIVQPESRAEVLNGRLLFAMPADEPHGHGHFTLSHLLAAHVARGYLGAVDMLTRTSKTSDFAPDASIYPEARDPKTGGRRLEELAFEIVSKQKLGIATRKARALSGRGVRRIFCVSLAKRQVLQWSAEADDWKPLGESDVIEDRCLVRPLPVRALLDATAADEAVVDAMIAKETPAMKKALADSREEGRKEGREAARRMLFNVLAARGVLLDETARARIDGCNDLTQLERWGTRAAVASRIDEVLADEALSKR
jgi:Uma2 family endonuclease